MILVKPICSFLSSEELCKNLNKFCKRDYTWNNIQLTSDNNAHYYIIIDKPNSEEYNDPKKTIIVYMKLQDNGNKANNELAYYRSIAHKYINNVIQWSINKTYSELISYQRDKNKILSSNIPSKIINKSFCNFLEYVNTKGDIMTDVYKDNLNDSLFPYKYTICIDDDIIDGILSECLCFYYGYSNVVNCIDNNAFIHINLDNFDEAYNTIKTAIENDEWGKRINYVSEARVKILNEFNIMNWIGKSISYQGKTIDFPIQKSIIRRPISTINNYDKIVKNVYWNYDPVVNSRVGYYGFMDYIRGCLSMYYICKENNWYFEVDYNNHNIGKYLNNYNSKYPEIKSDEKIFFTEQKNYEKVKNFIRSNKTSTFFTNLWYEMQPLTKSAKMFIQSSFVPNNHLENKIKEYMKNFNLIDKQFNCIHIRMGDKKLLDNTNINTVVYDKIGNLITDKLKETKYSKNIIISDDYDIKMYLSKKYGYYCINSKPCHLGNVKNSDDVVNTLVDYFIMSRCDTIVSYSIYGCSGFCYWCSVIFDIDYINVDMYY